jgi:hypothetical protein
MFAKYQENKTVNFFSNTFYEQAAFRCKPLLTAPPGNFMKNSATLSGCGPQVPPSVPPSGREKPYSTKRARTHSSTPKVCRKPRTGK